MRCSYPAVSQFHVKVKARECFLISQCSNVAGGFTHGAEFFGDEGCDVVCFQVAVGEGLVEGEVREQEAGQGRLVVVACVNADDAV